MHRRPILEILADYARRYPGEAAVADRFATFVAKHPDCFERTCVPGHITGSAWLISHDGGRFLLTHHRKLGRWLQLGGHAEGDPPPAEVALREASEESGIADLRLAVTHPIDLDAHDIPATPTEPAHVHYDLRFLVVAPPDAVATTSPESIELRWFDSRRPLDVPHDASVVRLRRKAEQALADRAPALS